MGEKNFGYIYIYKCVVGSGSDICKIGITKNFHDRLKQHVRTPYYGFMPYVEFTTGNPIFTAFKVRDYDLADNLIEELLNTKKIGNYEIYNIDYEEAIKIIYKTLVKKDRLIELIKEDYTDYDYLEESEFKAEKEMIDTRISVFKDIVKQLLLKYNDELPEEVLVMLRDKEDYIDNCNSHYIRGNYVEFTNNLILDLNYNKATRLEILNKLKKFI
ncbi:MAG: GIY-YIG nuclease family protein [Bacilli bacterium]|nr:GIY-YIG nuclease family protein [Bacilli bacterium]